MVTIKEFIGKAEYDNSGQMIFGNRNGDLQQIADIRGWGAIQHKFPTEKEAGEFQDLLGQFVADAINEKLQKETK